ncbi:MAG TPA: hypothetical protein VKT29_11575 [Terriglobales bacterium]|nr:hypothetical protein [Terriglobales bacterium]
MAKSALEDFRSFAGITEAWELVTTGLVVIGGISYKLELWHSYSNPDIPYYVSTYLQESGVWRKMPDHSFPIAPNGEEAMRTAMAFLVEQHAA